MLVNFTNLVSVVRIDLFTSLHLDYVRCFCLSKEEKKGQNKQVEGRVRRVTGAVLGDTTEERRGKKQETVGKAQEKIGRIKRKTKEELETEEP